jgi:putative ABC transport system ATP-binding protein
LADRRLIEISGGEGQRVAIARAMCAEPAILFADEPTGSLDASTGAAVMDAMIGAVAAHRTSLVLITHDREVAARADRIVHLRDGALHSREDLADVR